MMRVVCFDFDSKKSVASELVSFPSDVGTLAEEVLLKGSTDSPNGPPNFVRPLGWLS